MPPPRTIARRDELEARRERQRAKRRERRTGWIAIGAALVGVVVLLLVVGSPGKGEGGPDVARLVAEVRTFEEERRPEIELPRGGRRIFPRYRVLAFDGAPGQPALGPIGRVDPAEAARRLERRSGAFRSEGREVLPAFHLIAVVAQADAGEDGLYRLRLDRAVLDRYLRVARAHEMLLLLDIQPGYADFIDEVRRLEPLLREPDVGIALDPEWHLAEGEIPGSVLGTVDAKDVNDVAEYMQEITAEEDLPEKLLLIHQFDASMITNRDAIRDRPRVAVAFSIDGFGSPALKRGVYRRLAPRAPQRSGFKLFFEEDYPVMSPESVLRLRPQPQVIVYE